MINDEVKSLNSPRDSSMSFIQSFSSLKRGNTSRESLFHNLKVLRIIASHTSTRSANAHSSHFNIPRISTKLTLEIQLRQ